MTAKITSRQKQQAQKLVGDALTALDPTKDGMQRVLESKEFQTRFKQMVMELAVNNVYYKLLSDEEAFAWIVEFWKSKKSVLLEARAIIEGYRQKARVHGVADTAKIHAEVLPSCLFKRDIPQMGPTWEDFKDLQNWNFPDPATEHALVSLVPAPLAGSTNKSVSEQTAVIAAFKTEAKLPAWHKVSFGSVNHVAGMSLAHFNATGKNPFANIWVRTDTYVVGGGRLVLNWREGRLNYGHWAWDGGRDSDLAVFLVGVIKAFGRSVSRS